MEKLMSEDTNSGYSTGSLGCCCPSSLCGWESSRPPHSGPPCPSFPPGLSPCSVRLLGKAGKDNSDSGSLCSRARQEGCEERQTGKPLGRVETCRSGLGQKGQVAGLTTDAQEVGLESVEMGEHTGLSPA